MKEKAMSLDLENSACMWYQGSKKW